MHAPEPPASQTRRERLLNAVRHLEHVLPGQAPIRDFVHHNTVHGFQDRPFPEALREVHAITGIAGYLPIARFRALLQEGRIALSDVLEVLAEAPSLGCSEALGPLTRGEVYRVCLLTEIPSLTAAQLVWHLEERQAHTVFQPGVGEEMRDTLRKKSPDQSDAMLLEDLWYACLEVLGVASSVGHVESLLDLTSDHAQQLLAHLEKEDAGQQKTRRKIKHLAQHILHEWLQRIGRDLTLGGALRALTGQDLLAQHRTYLIRHLASFLDQGLSPWPLPARQKGFYSAWKESAQRDLAPVFEELPTWRETLEALPSGAVEAVEHLLSALALPEALWPGYLERLALELPGWSGMVMWRSLRPGYQGLTPERVDMMEYLAVRLALERIFAQRLCRTEWGIEPSVESLRTYFEQAHAELLGRWMLLNAPLPDYLSSRIQPLLERPSSIAVRQEEEWWAVAPMIVAWQFYSAGERIHAHSAHRHGWPLFMLAQHLGLSAREIRNGDSNFAWSLLKTMARLEADTVGYLWLQAYERHYHQQILGAIAGNHGRGRWATRSAAPTAQLVFCMDDREEGFRRHVEERNPTLETLGAAGFFGVPMYWQGLDEERATALCPIVVTPAHTVKEVSGHHESPLYTRHRRGLAWRRGLQHLFFRRTHRGWLGSTLLTLIGAPGALVVLVGKVLAPLATGRAIAFLRQKGEGTVPTTLTLSAPDSAPPATSEHPRLGFTDAEQAIRVEGLLRTIGLTRGFAPLVVIVGHGSSSQNNPHRAAYDCGACSGRHGGPNARVFAAMANRPEVRTLLYERGITIPESTWFLGAAHDTASEAIGWYDQDQIPDRLRGAWTALQADLAEACARSAQERARRLASAPHRPTPPQALAHVAGRAMDFSQARPELGHVTNAVAVIGRRSVTQGVFFDRRMFLISYDPTEDPDGRIVEGILLAAGPVGAGITMEYYFSTVDSERFGCGSKVTHNLTGFLGVMEGTSSDLRTGLPRQMTEIHEAMRLLIIVEQQPDILTALYERQPILRELVGNAWIHLAAKEPESGILHRFRPGVGWTVWYQDPNAPPLPCVNASPEWFMGHKGPLTPALIRQPVPQQPVPA